MFPALSTGAGPQQVLDKHLMANPSCPCPHTHPFPPSLTLFPTPHPVSMLLSCPQTPFKAAQPLAPP